MTVRFTASLDSIDRAIAAKQQAIAKAARPAAQAMAQVFYEAARSYVPVGKKGHWFHGTSFKKYGTKYWFDAGSLRKAIYQVHSKDKSQDGGVQSYHISWNASKAPYGFMVEFGTVKSPAHPFMRPAAMHGNAAVAAGKAVLSKLVEAA